MNKIEAKRKELEEDSIKENSITGNGWIIQMQLEYFNLGVEMARKEFEETILNIFCPVSSNSPQELVKLEVEVSASEPIAQCPQIADTLSPQTKPYMNDVSETVGSTPTPSSNKLIKNKPADTLSLPSVARRNQVSNKSLNVGKSPVSGVSEAKPTTSVADTQSRQKYAYVNSDAMREMKCSRSQRVNTLKDETADAIQSQEAKK